MDVHSQTFATVRKACVARGDAYYYCCRFHAANPFGRERIELDGGEIAAAVSVYVARG
jgi:hypothetical protein